MFVIAPNWKQPKCPLIDEYTSKLRYIYTVEYSLAIKRNKLLICNRMNESQNNYAEFSVCNCENSLLYLKMCLFHIHAWKNIFSGNRILSWQLSFNSLCVSIVFWLGFKLWVGKIPWKREQLPTPVFWVGEFHGWSQSRTRLSDFHFKCKFDYSPKA